MCAQDEDEDWGRWRDVVFRAKGRLTPHGLDLKPPPPQNRRKRGGPAFVKDPWKAKKEEDRVADAAPSTDVKADVVEKADVAEKAEEQNVRPEAEEPEPTQLTTSEALSKLAIASEEISSLNLQPDDSSHDTAASVPTLNGMTYCPECYLPLHPDPKPERLYIFLHALRYTTSLGRFETEMPEWAAKGWEWDRS